MRNIRIITARDEWKLAYGLARWNRTAETQTRAPRAARLAFVCAEHADAFDRLVSVAESMIPRD